MCRSSSWAWRLAFLDFFLELACFLEDFLVFLRVVLSVEPLESEPEVLGTLCFVDSFSGDPLSEKSDVPLGVSPPRESALAILLTSVCSEQEGSSWCTANESGGIHDVISFDQSATRLQIEATRGFVTRYFIGR